MEILQHMIVKMQNPCFMFLKQVSNKGRKMFVTNFFLIKIEQIYVICC